MARNFTRRLLAALPILGLGAGLGFAQRIPQPLPTIPTVSAPAEADGPEVLARGPVHEAFATTAEQPSAGPVIEKRPADPIEELPPDQRPDGDNVQWIPGYWHFDEERKDYIWISGFWRNAPPGRVWVPGGWQEVRGGYQWVHGFWNVAAKDVKQAELEYLPPPPATIETGPTSVSPGEAYFYTPGSWVYRTNRYLWRPGFWVEHRRDWCWVPDHYRWTPAGYVFIPGYWDVPPATRGVLFAPVYFRPAVLARPRFVYTPVYAVPETCLHTTLFVRSGHASYYFGDYYEPRYVTAGYTSWAAASFRGTNFAVTVGVGRAYTYDPMWSYYTVQNRADPVWQTNITNVYVGRYKGDLPRPPQTLVQQTTVVNNVTNVTNVTNNTNVIVNNTTNNKTVNTAAAAPMMLAPLSSLKTVSPGVTLKAVSAEDRTKEQKAAKEIQQVAVDRRAAETNLVSRGLAVTKADDKPRQVKMDMPQAAMARAQMPTTPEKAPPPPAAAGQKKADPPAPAPIKTPLPGDKPADKPTLPVVPKPGDPTKPADPPRTTLPVTPKPGDPPKPILPVVPKADPPKTDPPKTPVTPMPTPMPTPKPGDPPKLPVTPVTPPKGEVKPDPKPGSTLPTVPKVDPPKADPPKTPVVPPVPPKVDPPKSDPPKGPGTPVVPPMPPKVDPPKPPVVPATPPKVDPPKVDPPKTPAVPPVAPKVDPPKADPPKAPITPASGTTPKADPPKPGTGAPMTPPARTTDKPKDEKKKDDKK